MIFLSPCSAFSSPRGTVFLIGERNLTLTSTSLYVLQNHIAVKTKLSSVIR